MAKKALITGASSGIGYEFAHLCAKDGYDLILVARDKAALDAAAKEMTKTYGVSALSLSMDLSLPNSIDTLWGKCSSDPLDLVINNAGFGDLNDFTSADWPKLESMIQLNITSLTRLSQLAAIKMVKQGHGSIVNVASILSFFPAPHSAVYGATKAYVLNFSEALSEELKHTGVHVTTLAPGPTKTRFAKAANMEHANVMKGNLPTGKEVAKYGFNAMKKQKVVAVHGFKTKAISLFVPRFMPRSVMRKIIAKVQS